MDTIEDFDKWLAEYKPPQFNYVAVFNPETGSVLSVGPEFAFADEIHKVVIDKNLAQSIINAEIQIHNCMIDIMSGELQIAELQTLTKLDDVLHRVTSIGYSDIVNPDVYITYLKNNKTLIIELSAELGGTKKYSDDTVSRNIVWDGSTYMDFYITGYNDPNEIYQIVTLKIEDLIDKSYSVKNIKYPRFSIYTKRLFKKYAIEYK